MLENILKSILDGNCILFTGADFSKDKNTKNLNNKMFLRGSELARKLLYDCAEEESDDLEYASEIYIEKKSKLDLINFMQQEFKCKVYSKLHEEYAKLPWKNIYTTNYDNILEMANSKYRPLTINSLIKMHTYKYPFILHINGFIDTLNEDSFNYEFKLTKTSYLIDAFNSSEWKHIFISDIKVSDYIIFIGYSFNDFDIEKILFSDEFMNKKIVFITSEREDKVRDYKLKKFGEIFNIGKEKFLKSILEYKERYEPQKNKFPRFNSFNFIKELSINLDKITDKEVFEFFMYGISKKDLICKSILHRHHCCVHSKSINSIIQSLRHNKIVSLSSDMGNGKTIMVEMIKCYALNNGFKIFSFKEKSSTFAKELDFISQYNDKNIIIVESYHNKIEILRELYRKMNSNSSLLLTERTVFDDLYLDRIEDIFGKKIDTFDLNTMPIDELKELINIFQLYGFAGFLKSKGDINRQVEFLYEDLKGSMFLILMNLMKSKNMQNKAKEVFSNFHEKLSKSPSNYEVFISLLILSIMDYSYNSYNFYELIGNDPMLQRDFTKDPSVKQIINYDQGIISIKSSILSNFILQNFIQDDVIIKIILKILDNALKNKEYMDLAKELINFSALERILPKRRRTVIISFYEAVKKYKYFSNNLHFWLQYAIAMISVNEFDRANEYFKNAYSIARVRKWKKTDILDNHYARFLLDKNIRVNEKNEKFCEDFIKAHEKLKVQILNNSNVFFPFKVASNYADFYRKFSIDINNSQECKKFIQNSITFVINSIDKLPHDSHIKENYFVKDCLFKLIEIQSTF